MAQFENISSIDVGSQSIRAVVAQIDQNGELQIIGASSFPSEGISKGVINSIEDAVSSISQALEKVERMTGFPVESAAVNISGPFINIQSSHGVVAVSRVDGEIQEEDVERVIDAAQAIAVPPNYEILHVLPKRFIVDHQRDIKDPVGMTGVRLEVDIQLIETQSSHIKSLTKCIYRTGVDIETLAYSILATAEAVLDKKQKEVGVVLLDIGANTTKIIVFEEGEILHSKILPIGANHITSDIAIGLRTSLDVAEKIKLQYGTASVQSIDPKATLNLSEYTKDTHEDVLVLLSHIGEIIEARVEEIYILVDKELRAINRSGLLPAGAVITGGGAKLDGMVEVAKRILRLPAFIGESNRVGSLVDKINDPEYSTAIGLLLWANKSRNGEGHGKNPSFSSIKKVKGKMTDWIKSLMP